MHSCSAVLRLHVRRDIRGDRYAIRNGSCYRIGAMAVTRWSQVHQVPIGIERISRWDPAGCRLTQHSGIPDEVHLEHLSVDSP